MGASDILVPWAREGSHFNGNLEVKQKEKLQELLKGQHLKTARAYQFRLTFQDIFTLKNRHQGATLLKAWMENAKDSGLPPMVKVAYTIMSHWDGVLRWIESQITNGILEVFHHRLLLARRWLKSLSQFRGPL